MNDLSFKNIILTLLQMPVILVQCINALVELLLTKCMVRLANPLLNPFERKQDKPGLPGEYDIDTSLIFELLSKKNSFVIMRCRRVIEGTEAGRRAVKTNPDRHLYAVLRPNRQENLRRIKNALDEMTPAEFSRILENAKELSKGV